MSGETKIVTKGPFVNTAQGYTKYTFYFGYDSSDRYLTELRYTTGDKTSFDLNHFALCLQMDVLLSWLAPEAREAFRRELFAIKFPEAPKERSPDTCQKCKVRAEFVRMALVCPSCKAVLGGA